MKLVSLDLKSAECEDANGTEFTAFSVSYGKWRPQVVAHLYAVNDRFVVIDVKTAEEHNHDSLEGIRFRISSLAAKRVADGLGRGSIRPGSALATATARVGPTR